MATVPDWLGSLLFGYRHVQSAGTPVNDSDTLNLSSAFSVAYNPATKVVDIGVAGGTVSDYIRATGSGGSSGLSVGRFDITSANPYAPIPGTLAIGNDDGSDFSLQIDNGSSLITSNLDLTVNGRVIASGPIAANGGISVTGSLTVGGQSVVTVARTVQGTTGILVNGVTSAVALSSNLTLSLGTVTTANGGTGQSSYTTGDIPYASGSTTISKLAVGGANTVLVGGGSTPAYSATPTLTSVTTTTLTVNGKSVVGPNARSVTHSDSPVTAADGDVITMDATAGTIAVTVPITAGARVKLKRKITDTSTNAITVSPASGTIEGGASLTFSTVAGSALEINGDGTNAGLW